MATAASPPDTLAVASELVCTSEVVVSFQATTSIIGSVPQVRHLNTALAFATTTYCARGSEAVGTVVVMANG
jgi:hypothetical protein